MYSLYNMCVFCFVVETRLSSPAEIVANTVIGDTDFERIQFISDPFRRNAVDAVWSALVCKRIGVCFQRR